MTKEEARITVAKLGFEYDNTAIKAEAFRQQEEGLIDSTEEFIEKAVEAIEVSERLFGIGSSDVTGLKSHIDLLQTMKGLGEENEEIWGQSVSQIANYFEVTDAYVEDNLTNFTRLINLMSEWKPEFDKNGKLKESASESFKEIERLAEELNIDLDVNVDEGKIESSTQKVKDNTQAKKDNAKASGDIANATQVEKQAVDVLNTSFSFLKSNLSTTNRTAYLQGVATQLDELDGKFVVTKDKAGNLKLAMADGSTSPYLQTLQSQLGELGIKIGLTEDEAGNLKLNLNDGTGSTTLSTIDQQAEDAKFSIDDTIDRVDILNTKKLFPNDYSQINFSEIQSGVDETTEKVQILSEALQGTGENTEALSSIKGLLQDLSNMATDLGSYIKNALNGSTGDLDTIADKAKTAKTKVDNLKKAIQELKNTAKGMNLGGLDRFEKDVKNANKALDSLDDTFNKIPRKARDMADAVKSASNKAERALKDHKKATDKLGDEYDDVSDDIRNAMSDASKSVSSRTSSMIGKHNSHRSAINRLADSARSAKNAISDMVSSARGAMDDLDGYIAKANRAKSAGNNIPRVPNSGLLGFLGFGLGTTPNSAEGESAQTAMSSFSASSEGNGAGSSAGGEGSSGIMRQSIYDGGLNLDGQYMMNAFELQDLVRPNYNERDMTVYNGIISQLETRMQRIVKSTTSYRDALKQVINYQNTSLRLTKKELDTVTKRNAYVNKRLKQLSKTSRHSEKQREEYNKLQNEYDSNLSKIASLKASVESITNEIRNKSIEIFSDFIDEITTKYDSAIESIQKKTDDIDFKIDVLGLTDPDNVEKQLQLLADKARKLKEEEETTGNKRDSLKSQYDGAVRKYGRNSEQAKKALAEYEKASEAYEDAIIKTLQAEKQIQDTRGKVADDGIKELKDYYGKMKDMALKAIDIEKRELEKAHQSKMEMYDEEIEKVNSVYDEKLKKMDEEKSQAEYQEELDTKNTKKAELLNKISLLSRDTSLEGRKKVEELKKELADTEKEIADFMEARQDELLRQSIEKQKQDQLDALNAKKETETETYNGRVEELDTEKEDITTHYDEMLNDEQYWANMRNGFIEGSFDTLNNKLANMSQSLSDMSKGNFDSLTQNFHNFSDAVKKEFAELNRLAVDNMIYTSGSVIGQVGMVGDTSYNPYTGSGTSVKNPTYTSAPKPAPKPQPKPTPPPPKPAPKRRYHQVKSGDTLWDLAQEYYGNPYKWSTIAEANGSPDPRKLEIGRKLLIPFKSGGYTGDWSGDDGKVALLHKKELVLNERQTSDILDTAKILNKIKDVIPAIKRSSVSQKFEGLSGAVINNYELTVNIDRLNGDKEGANTVVRDIMKGLKKMGK
jgi:nucleoid-associated protein YgaU